MTVVSNDPSLWPIISYFGACSYLQVACVTAVVYDWALSFGQEFELVWRQRWSLMTFLYLSVRYIGIPYTIVIMLPIIPFDVSLTDAGCTITYFMHVWIDVIVNVMLATIIVARLHAMYQQSRRMLIFLILACLPAQIASAVITAIVSNMYVSGEEYVLSGAHMCGYEFSGDIIFLSELTWILAIAWETLALCLAMWIAVKHFRELQGSLKRWAAEDCFTVLVKSHVFYFASFIAVSTLELINFSPNLYNSTSVPEGVYIGIIQFSRIVQMFILGPHLILGLREYHANLVADSDEGTAMTSMNFQERVHVSTGSGV